MAKSKKNAKPQAIEHESVSELRIIADALKYTTLPPEQVERFNPMLNRVEARIRVLADSLQKTIAFSSVKAEREAKTVARKEAARAKTAARIAKMQEILQKLEASLEA